VGGSELTESKPDFAPFQVGAVRRASDITILRKLQQMEGRGLPIALLRSALHLLGSEVTYAAFDDNVPASLKGGAVLHIRFGECIETLFDISSPVFMYLSSFDDFRHQAWTQFNSRFDSSGRNIAPHVRMLHSPDERLARRVEDWDRGDVLTVPFGPLSNSPSKLALEILDGLRERLGSRNLYEETLPVSGDQFFGRRQIVTDVLTQVRQGKICGVFGLRKSGKTSVIKRVGERLEGDPKERWIFVLRDLETLPHPPEDPIPSLLADLRTNLQPRLKAANLRTHELASLGVSSPPTIEDFRRALQASITAAAADDVRILVALDEVEFLVLPSLPGWSMPSIAQFFGALRSLVQENDNFSVLVSGITSRIVEEGRIHERPNPFFSWAVPRFVGSLDPGEARELVATLGRRMAMQWSDEALARLHQETGGHPFLLRTIASRVKEETRGQHRSLQVADVDAVLRPWQRSVSATIREVYESLESWYPDELGLLDTLLSSPAEFEELAEVFPGAVEHLLQLGLITESSDGFRPGAIASIPIAR